MNYRWALVALAFALTACASTSGGLRKNSLPDMVRAAPERFIVVTVANDALPLVSRAGSTPRAYSGFQNYAASSLAREMVAAIARDYHLHEVAAWPIATLGVHCVVFQIPDESSRATILAQLAREPRVALAEPLNTFETMSQTYNDPYVGLQHGFELLGVADAHRWSRGDGVRVAIVDTGVDVDHPELQDRIAATRNFVDDDAARFRRDRHGTEVAGVIAALANNKLGIVGVAPGVRLIALKACWQLDQGADGARCNSFTLAKALVAAMDQGAQVVNLSLAGPQDPLLAALVAAGLRRGIVFVGSVSPPALASLNGFPGGTAGVLAVDASETHGTHARALLAPGREILTLTPHGHYDFASGASLATAQVTGTVALILAQNRSVSAAAIHDLLSRTSIRTPTDGKPIESINACAALATITGEDGCENTSLIAHREKP